MSEAIAGAKIYVFLYQNLNFEVLLAAFNASYYLCISILEFKCNFFMKP